VKTPAKKKVKTNTKDVTASPAFFTACEKIPPKRKNVKSRNTKAIKKINFDRGKWLWAGYRNVEKD